MKIGFGLLLAIGLVGCDRTHVRELLKDLRGPKYLRTASGDNLKIEIQYLPRTVRLLGRAQLDDSEIVTNRTLDSLEAASSDTKGLCFLLRLEPKDSVAGPGFSQDMLYGGLGGFGNYQETLKAYMFGLKDKIWLESEGRKIPLSNYQMENSYGMTRGRNFVLVFDSFPANAGKRYTEANLVLDDIVPGLARKKLNWTFPVGKYDQSI